MLDNHSVMGITRQLRAGGVLKTVHPSFGALRRLVARFKLTPTEENEKSITKILRTVFKKSELEVVYEFTKKHLEYGDMYLFHRAWRAYDFNLDFCRLASGVQVMLTPEEDLTQPNIDTRDEVFREGSAVPSCKTRPYD